MSQHNLDAFMRQVASNSTLWGCASLFADGHLHDAASRLAVMAEALGCPFDPQEFSQRASQYEPRR
ncbi:hypothetical protein V8Z80_08130 [Orrella sp. JC864]|uniref:hypothetical protein n=1 Tax=Orrella sp. JC864 TaxID=3120298 RepID=UPI0012BC26D4